MNSTYLIDNMNIQETKTREQRQKRREGRRKASEREQIDSGMHQYHGNFKLRLRSSAFGLSATETQGTCCPTTSFLEECLELQNPENNCFTLIHNHIEA